MFNLLLYSQSRSFCKTLHNRPRHLTCSGFYAPSIRADHSKMKELKPKHADLREMVYTRKPVAHLLAHNCRQHRRSCERLPSIQHSSLYLLPFRFTPPPLTASNSFQSLPALACLSLENNLCRIGRTSPRELLPIQPRRQGSKTRSAL